MFEKKELSDKWIKMSSLSVYLFGLLLSCSENFMSSVEFYECASKVKLYVRENRTLVQNKYFNENFSK